MLYDLTKGVPPTSSYWVGVTREELRQRVQARRHQQARGGWSHGLAWDTSIDAEISLRQRLALHKAEREARAKVGRR